MLEELALVTRSDEHHVFVKSLQVSACSHCQQQSSCGASLYARFLPKRELALRSPVSLQVGDKVIIGIEESQLLRTSLLLYLLPLLIMLVIVGLMESHVQAAASAVAALSGLAAGFYVAHRIQKKFLYSFFVPPQIVRKANNIDEKQTGAQAATRTC